MSYTAQEAAALGHVNEKTIFRWMDNGLEAVPCGKPFLFLGSALQDFLRKKHSKGTFTLKKNEFPCFTCKAPRRAKKGSIRKFKDKKTALCSVCNGKMSRTIQSDQKYYTEPLFPK